MPPFALPADDSGSDSDSDAPEAISLAQTKKDVQSESKKIKALQDEKRRADKERRRKTDERLKEQKSRKKAESRKDEDPAERMERAMAEAADEEESDEDEEEEELELGSRSDARLPDELFRTAFAASQEKPPSPQKKPEDQARRRKKPSRTGAKDTIVGDRVVQKLEKPSVVHLSMVKKTSPDRKTRRFVERNLALGASKKATGYQRRPVNVGVMRRDGPALSFRRNS